MTHEFKTPISTISLAAQMLNDGAVLKSPAMLSHISTVINDETKRLRFREKKCCRCRCSSAVKPPCAFRTSMPTCL